jgi:hypothetical protein
MAVLTKNKASSDNDGPGGLNTGGSHDYPYFLNDTCFVVR